MDAKINVAANGGNPKLGTGFGAMAGQVANGAASGGAAGAVAGLVQSLFGVFKGSVPPEVEQWRHQSGPQPFVTWAEAQGQKWGSVSEAKGSLAYWMAAVCDAPEHTRIIRKSQTTDPHNYYDATTTSKGYELAGVDWSATNAAVPEGSTSGAFVRMNSGALGGSPGSMGPKNLQVSVGASWWTKAKAWWMLRSPIEKWALGIGAVAVVYGVYAAIAHKWPFRVRRHG